MAATTRRHAAPDQHARPGSRDAWHKAVHVSRASQVMLPTQTHSVYIRAPENKRTLCHPPSPPDTPEHGGLGPGIAAPPSCSGGQKIGRFSTWQGLPFCLPPPQTLQKVMFPSDNLPGMIPCKTAVSRKKSSQPAKPAESAASIS